jgi:hypothetical protein
MQLPFSSSERLNEIIQTADLVESLAGITSRVELGSDKAREAGRASLLRRLPLDGG